MEDDFSNIPDFDSLPKVEGMPQGCAWGLFDRHNQKDTLGCLNLLTPKVIQSALREGRDGHSVSLNWDIGGLDAGGFARKRLVHNVMSFMDNEDKALHFHGNDDEVEFNTQCSSQWDSLVHFAHQASGKYYNNSTANETNLVQPHGQRDGIEQKQIPTLNHWHDRGGLVARGVLLDYRAYADAHGIEFNCFAASRIFTEDLDKVIAWQNVELKQGDVILVRTGFIEQLSGISGEQQAHKLSSRQCCGVDGSINTARWFWNHHPSAVAGDAIAFEQFPPLHEDGTPGGIKDLVLHQYFLALFGLHIGELWDLSNLSKMCAEKKRYSFLLTSVPLNVAGLVGSPANALAVF